MAKTKVAPAPTISKDEEKWRAEDDLRTLMRAHEIKRDPKRHGAAKKHAKTQLDALKAHVNEDPAPDGGATKE